MADVASPAHVGGSYVEWGAVIAGAVTASAISFVLLTAGASIGLSLISPYPSQSYGGTALYLASFWAIVVPILSLLVGGYIAGRMRATREDANADEVQFRDGIHGLLVWGLSILAGGLLVFLAATTAAQSGAQVAGAALADRGSVIAPAVDSLFINTVVVQAGAGEPAQSNARSTAANQTAAGRAVVPTADTRDVVTRTLASAVAGGQLTDAQRQTLAQIVSDRTGLSSADAEKRVNLAYDAAVRAADTSRKGAVLAGLVTATALLVGLLAAWFAAQNGGRHRDQNIPAKFVWRGGSRPVRTPAPTPK